jgi:hypothetical protein
MGINIFLRSTGSFYSEFGEDFLLSMTMTECGARRVAGSLGTGHGAPPLVLPAARNREKATSTR